MKLSQSQLESMNLVTEEHGVFTPLYTYEEYIIPTDKMEGSNQLEAIYEGVVIVKTAEEVYQEWLNPTPVEPVPSPEEQIEALESEVETLKLENKLLRSRVDATEDAVMELIISGMNA